MIENLTEETNFSMDGTNSQLRQEYEAQRTLFLAQPALTQRFLEMQAHQIAEAVVQKLPQVRFSLPDRVQLSSGAHGKNKTLAVPENFREQMAGGLLDRLTRNDSRSALRQRLSDLEASKNTAVAAGAGLLRFVTVQHMVYSMLPSGRSVTYLTPAGEEIAVIPAGEDTEPGSAITAETDAIAEEGPQENERGELLVPYVSYARRFFLPQWVAFDQQGRLLVHSINEAEAHIASMQHFLYILHTAVSIAPYWIADDVYRQKRYGMLGQLVNQGRALASYETNEIIRTIRRRAAAQDLNRGLGLSVPYFNDQTLTMQTLDFEVIPAGRIMFVPAFVVRAVREEQAKVALDTRLSPSTRKYLEIELKRLEEAFH